MLKFTRYFEIDIEGSKFVFHKPTKRELLEWKNDSDTVAAIFKKLISVSGLEDENGKVEIGPELHLDLPIDVVRKITDAWRAEFYSMLGAGDQSVEKKASAVSLNGSSTHALETQT